MQLAKVLVVDASDAGRDTLQAVVSPHCEEVFSAATCAEAKLLLAAHPDLALIVAEVALPDREGIDLLAFVSCLDEPRPRVVIVTARPSELEDLRSADLGADGYLAKPIFFRDIARMLKQTQGGVVQAAYRVRSRAVGHALLLNEQLGTTSETRAHLAWDIDDLSVSGAFLETKGAVPVGQALRLELVLGRRNVRVHAKVVRVQEPCWDHAAGVGVAFTQFEGDGEKDLAAWIEAVRELAERMKQRG